MFARASVLSLALFSSAVIGQKTALKLDITSQDSIKENAKTFAEGIVAFYNEAVTNSSIPGLFPDPYYFWEAGTVLNSLAEYSRLTGDSQYDQLISDGLQFQLGDFKAFMPLNQTKSIGNDDQSAWGLASMAATEGNLPKPKEGEWVDFAKNVWELQTQRLAFEEGSNGTCDGGLRWQIYPFNRGYDWKNSATNGNYFLLSARLAKFTGNETYTQWAEKSYTWAKEIGLISQKYQVFSGADSGMDCTSINEIQWTSDHAIYTEGAALMYNITNGGKKWTEAVTSLATSSSVFHNGSAISEVACEGGDKCDIDMRAFKGLAMRSYSRAVVAAPIISDKLTPMLEASANATTTACAIGKGDVECRLNWIGEEGLQASATDGNLGEVFNALCAVQGLLQKSSGPLATVNGTKSGSTGGNATQSGGAAAPTQAGAAGTIAASFTAVLAIAFAVALSC